MVSVNVQPDRSSVRPLTPTCDYTAALDDVILLREAPFVLPFRSKLIPTF